MITIENVVKRHGERIVLGGVHAHVEQGEIVALVGPSGCGKTTLLRCINGLDHFDEGRVVACGNVLLPGRPRSNEEALAAIRRRVGFVFQAYHLFAHRTVVGNIVEAPVHVRGLSAAAAKQKAEALMDKVGLSHRAQAYPHELSGGEQQRVAIARALAMEPDVLLLDEPTSALDSERVASLTELLKALAIEKQTLLVVTHDVSFARAIASRTLILERGHALRSKDM